MCRTLSFYFDGCAGEIDAVDARPELHPRVWVAGALAPVGARGAGLSRDRKDAMALVLGHETTLLHHARTFEPVACSLAGETIHRRDERAWCLRARGNDHSRI